MQSLEFQIISIAHFSCINQRYDDITNLKLMLPCDVKDLSVNSYTLTMAGAQDIIVILGTSNGSDFKDVTL